MIVKGQNEESLTKGSHKLVKVICDICDKEYETMYKSYYKNIQRNGKCICFYCSKHDEEQVKKMIDKQKETCYKNFGGNSWLTTHREEFDKKCEELYGGHPMRNSEIKKKHEEYFIDKYGVKNPGMVLEFREKAIATMTLNNNYPISSQEKNILDILSRNFPSANISTQYQYKSSSFDILFEMNDIKIDIECDGTYWHTDSQKDRRRDEVTKAGGYKVFRIRYRRFIPEEKEILDSLNILLTTNKDYIRIHSKDSKKGD